MTKPTGKPANSKRHRYRKEVRDFCINAKLVKEYTYESIREAAKIKFPGEQIPSQTTIMLWCGYGEKTQARRKGRDAFGPKQEPAPPELAPIYRGKYEITLTMPVMEYGQVPTLAEVVEQLGRANQMLLSREVQRLKSQQKSFESRAIKDRRDEAA